MQTIQDRLYLASNVDVLSFLHDQEKVQRDRVQWALKSRKDLLEGTKIQIDEDAERKRVVPDDLRSVQYEVSKYLVQSVLPQTKQSVNSTKKLVQSLIEQFPELTKVERLQLVNLAPTDMVELYSIIPKLEERIPDEDRYEQLLNLCQLSLTDEGQETFGTISTNDIHNDEQQARPHDENKRAMDEQAAAMDQVDEMEYQELTEAQGDQLIDEGRNGASKEDQGLELDEQKES